MPHRHDEALAVHTLAGRGGRFDRLDDHLDRFAASKPLLLLWLFGQSAATCSSQTIPESTGMIPQ